jgi:hypothetical protein
MRAEVAALLKKGEATVQKTEALRAELQALMARLDRQRAPERRAAPRRKPLK